jgi:DNA-binding transcriptional MerR regulator
MGDESLISKKDVLDQMGISYGQLYRWKRKGLIPESWFIRQSTFTGQETFFPKDKIIERIGRIKDMKTEHALDDLAEVISEHVNAKLQVAFDKLAKLGWYDESLFRTVGIVDEARAKGTLSLRDAFRVAVLKKLRRAAREEEIELASQTLQRALKEKTGDLTQIENKSLHLLRKRVSASGISAEISAVVIASGDLVVDPELHEIDSVDLASMLQQIKLDLAKCCGSDEDARTSSDEEPSGREDDE